MQKSKIASYIRNFSINLIFFSFISSYHQKYRLQQHNYLVEEIGLKPDLLLSSHLAARLNGYVVGMGGVAQFNNEAPSLGLSEKATEYVRKYVTKYEGHGLTC